MKLVVVSFRASPATALEVKLQWEKTGMSQVVLFIVISARKVEKKGVEGLPATCSCWLLWWRQRSRSLWPRD